MRRLLLRLLLTAATATPVAVVLPTGPGHVDCAGAAGDHHAAVVVEHGNGVQLMPCVPFSGDSVNGYDLLVASKIQFSTVDYGGSLGRAVCQVDSEPQSYPPSCFSSGGRYWAIFTARHGGSWQLSSHGISNIAFADGDAEGFRYDDQGGSLPAPDRSASGVCPPPSTPPSVQPTSPPAPPPSAPGASVGVGPPASTATAAVPSPSATPAQSAAAALEAPITPRSDGSTTALSAEPVAAAPVASSGNAGGWISVSLIATAMVTLLGWQIVRRRST